MIDITTKIAGPLFEDAARLRPAVRDGMAQAVDIGRDHLARLYGRLRSGPGRFGGHLADPGRMKVQVGDAGDLVVGVIRPTKFTAAIFESGATPHYLGVRQRRGRWRRLSHGRVIARRGKAQAGGTPPSVLAFRVGGRLIFRSNPSRKRGFASHPGVRALHPMGQTSQEIGPEVGQILAASVRADLDGQ